MFKSRDNKNMYFNAFNFFPLYAERLKRMFKYGKLSDKMYGGR